MKQSSAWTGVIRDSDSCYGGTFRDEHRIRGKIERTQIDVAWEVAIGEPELKEGVAESGTAAGVDDVVVEPHNVAESAIRIQKN